MSKTKDNGVAALIERAKARIPEKAAALAQEATAACKHVFGPAHLTEVDCACNCVKCSALEYLD